MDAFATITDENGDLLPTKIVPHTVRAPVLRIVTPPDMDNVESDGSDVSSEEEAGFYVEMSLTCVTGEDEREDHLLMFNFDTEENYMEHAENGFEEMETYFEEAISANFLGLNYADEWEEHHVYGDVLPEDHEGIVTDVH